MKIIINAFQYAPTITGTDRMAHNFLIELQKLDSENRYVVVCSNESYNRSAITSHNFTVIKPSTLPFGSFVQRVYNKLWRILLPVRLKLLGADIYFSFHNMQLPGIRVAKRMVVFNLDLIPIVLPGYESIHRKNKQELIEQYKKIAARADHFLSISEFSKNELCHELAIDADKVSVIHLAVSPDFATNAKLLTPGLTSGNYLLTIGGTEPRKNVETVVKAFTQLPPELQLRYPLAIIGGAWHGLGLEKFNQHPNIHCLGYVKENELPGLYKNAAAFIFASEYEGFGFTILEAMAAGTPVINAHGSSLDEVAGKATLTFDAKNASQLSEQITLLLSDDTLHARLIELGDEQSKAFSWEKSALKLHDIITGNNSLEHNL